MAQTCVSRIVNSIWRRQRVGVVRPWQHSEWRSQAGSTSRTPDHCPSALRYATRQLAARNDIMLAVIPRTLRHDVYRRESMSHNRCQTALEQTAADSTAKHTRCRLSRRVRVRDVRPRPCSVLQTPRACEVQRASCRCSPSLGQAQSSNSGSRVRIYCTRCSRNSF